MILLAGDSYTSCVDFRDDKSQPLYMWTEAICERFDAKCVGRPGASNYDILQQINQNESDLVIVNLTTLNRITSHWGCSRPSYKNKTTKQRVESASQLHARKVIELSHYVWSTFPDYTDWEEVHTIDLRQHDDMWSSVSTTGCHFTREGNDWMINHITQKIEEMQH